MKTSIAEIVNEIENGNGIALADATKVIGQHVNVATIFRWVNQGVPLPDGQRLRLEHARVGRKILTTAAAVRRFVAAATSSHLQESAPKTAKPRKPKNLPI